MHLGTLDAARPSNERMVRRRALLLDSQIGVSIFGWIELRCVPLVYMQGSSRAAHVRCGSGSRRFSGTSRVFAVELDPYVKTFTK